MRDLTVETFFPLNQESTSYQIKPLSQLQLSEVLLDHVKVEAGEMKITYSAAMRLLKFGLVDPALIDSMPALHIIEVAKRIFSRSMLTEEEEKN